VFTCLSSEIKSSASDGVDLVRSAAGYAIIGCHLLAAGGPACGWPGIRANMPTLPRRRSRIQHARCDISPPLHFAPGVECLVQRQAVPQQLVIVRVESRQTDRYRVKKIDDGSRDSCDRRGVPCERKFSSGPLLGKSPEQGQSLDAERLGKRGVCLTSPTARRIGSSTRPFQAAFFGLRNVANKLLGHFFRPAFLPASADGRAHARAE